MSDKILLLVSLIFLCAILYSLIGPGYYLRIGENYIDGPPYKLIDPNKIITFQGNSLPLDNLTPPKGETCKNADGPSVTDDSKDPHSLFEFAYNECHPKCCKTSNFGCQGGESGGCACLTNEQLKYFANRGGNRHITKCSSYDELDY